MCVLKNALEHVLGKQWTSAILDAQVDFGDRDLEQGVEISDESAVCTWWATSSMEPCELDIEEVQTLQKFMKDTCGCSKKPGSATILVEITEMGVSMAELSKDKIDLVTLG